MQDNSDLRHKIDLRHRALAALGRRPGLVLELFAGEGTLTRLLWRHAADRVVAVERDRQKALRIAGAEVIVDDNAVALHLAAEADLIDCDAYGLVMPLVERLPAGKLVVFTDGTPEKARKVWRAHVDFNNACNRLLRDVTIERSQAGNAFYGFGWTR